MPMKQALMPCMPRCARGIEKEKQEVERKEKEKKAKAKVPSRARHAHAGSSLSACLQSCPGACVATEQQCPAQQ